VQTRLSLLIKSRRRVRGLSVEDLAARIDCEASTVRRWERDGVLPAARHMPALRQALDLSLRDLDEACLEALGAPGEVLRVESVDHLSRTGKSFEALLDEIIALDIRNLRIEDVHDEGTSEQWIPIHESMPDTWRLLTCGDRVVGNWHIVPLDAATFERAKCGGLRDGEITIDKLDFISFPGFYNAYLSSYVLDPPYRYGRPFQMLFDSLAECLIRFAVSGVFFREVCTPAFTIEGRKMCERLGFEAIGSYRTRPQTPIFLTPVRKLVDRPEFARFPYLSQLYAGET
jgi:transcriptional regulator with XRE-family HTH domain